MTFAAPYWLWGILLLPLLVPWFVWRERVQRQRLQRVAAARLLPVLAGSVSYGVRRVRFALALLALAALLLALARPQHGFVLREQKSLGRDIILAVDTSRSMLANDLVPSRLARAKLAAEDLLGQLPGERVGLVAFAGTAFLQAPLTADHSAVLTSLHELDTQIIPQGGTNLAEAIRTAQEAFGKAEGSHRALVIFTDGEELEETAVAEAKALEGKVKIFTVGLGSPEGTIIALPGEDGRTEYVKSADGQIVKSRLDEVKLRELAEAGGGFYVHLRSGPAEMAQLVREGLDKLGKVEAEGEAQRVPVEKYQWPLAAALLLMAGLFVLGERRRVAPAKLSAALTLGVALFAFTVPVQAGNAGLEAYARGDYDAALKHFEAQAQRLPNSPRVQYDLGSAAFKKGDYNRAIDAYSQALAGRDAQVRDLAAYGLGNSLARRGLAQQQEKTKLQDWESAVSHYEALLKSQPQHADGRHNLEVVQKLIAELKQKQQPPPEDKQDKQDKQDQQEQQDKKDSQGQKDASEQPGKQEKADQKQGKDQQKGQEGKDQDQNQGRQDQRDQGSKEQGNQGQQDQAQQQKGGREEGKDQRDAEGGKKENQPKQSPGEGKGGQKDQAGDPQPQGEDASKQGGEKRRNQPQEAQNRKLQGQIESRPEEGQPTQNESNNQAEAEREAEAAAAGTMTPNQAANILESLRAEDERVKLLDPARELRQQQKRLSRPLRDW